MGRKVALIWHASMLVVAGLLYFFFVLPRWLELTGDTSTTLGLILRIVCGVAVGVAALPVVFSYQRSRRPEYTTPQLALTLRVWSIVLHVVAAVLIVGTAVSEIWVSLDRFGQLLFGIYGAAAAIALLGFFAFYLSFVAELPPPPPRPIGEEKERWSLRLRRNSKNDDADEDLDDEDSDEESAAATVDLVKHGETEDEESEDDASETAADDTSDSVDLETDDDLVTDEDPESDEDDDKELATTGLRNRRPSGKRGSRRRVSR